MRDFLPRVIALDLDGTLLRSDGSISPRTLLAIEACLEQGTGLVVATARPPRSVAALLPLSFPAVPWICYNGAETYERGQRVAHDLLSPALTRRIVADLRLLAPDAAISVEIDDHLFANKPLDEAVIHDVVDLDTVVGRPAAKVLFDATRCGNVDAIHSGLAGECRVVVTDQGRLGQIMSASASKARALEVLLGRWSRTLSDVIAFGDDINDLEMVAESRIGVAMGNACPELKMAADRVTTSNDEDGVAEMVAILMGEGLASLREVVRG